MKMILLRRLPPIGTANIMAIFRILGLLFYSLSERVYFRVLWGSYATPSGGNVPRLALFVFSYLVPIIVAWISGLILAAGYNAIVKSLGRGIRLGIDE